MKKRKVIFNEPDINSAEVKSKMNFDEILKKEIKMKQFRYKKYFMPKLILSIALITSLSYLITKLLSEPMHDNESKNKILIKNQTLHQFKAENQNSLLKDSLLHYTTTAISSYKRPSQNLYQDLSDYYKHNGVHSQKFIIESEKDTTIKGKQGTILSIDANSFVDRDNNLIKGEILLELKECYLLNDMLKENLSTMQKDNMLKTGGMIFIDAKQHGKSLFLAKYQEIEMYNPNELVGADTSMFIFHGHRNSSDYSIDWELDKLSRIPYPIATLYPESKKNDIRISHIEYFAEKYRFDKANMLTILDTIFFTFETETEPFGNVSKVKLLKERFNNTSLANALEEFKNVSQNFKKDNLSSSGVVNDRTQRYKFAILDRRDHNNYKYILHDCLTEAAVKKENLNKLAPINSKAVSHIDSISNPYYKIIGYKPKKNMAFYIKELGWANCDSYIEQKKIVDKSKILNNVRISKYSNNENTKLLFVDKNGLLTIIKPKDDNFFWTFSDIPVGVDAKIIGDILVRNEKYSEELQFQVQVKEKIKQKLSYNIPGDINSKSSLK